MRRIAALALVGAALLGACNDDDEDDTATTTTAAPDGPTSTSAPAEETTTTLPPLTGSSTPEEAAEAFVATFLPDATVTLGEFREGDARSGEMEVLRPSEGGGTANLASTLLLRLDDFDNWQVFAATNPNVTIEQPEQGSPIPSAPLTVAGLGRGFEATIVVRALDLDGQVVAESVATGGALAEPEPYETSLDLTEVVLNTPLVVLVSGGVGLEGDPGEFSVVRVITAS